MVVLVAVGFVLFAVLTARTVIGLRRFRRAANMVVADTSNRMGLLRARAAAVRVALAGWQSSGNGAARGV